LPHNSHRQFAGPFIIVIAQAIQCNYFRLAGFRLSSIWAQSPVFWQRQICAGPATLTSFAEATDVLGFEGGAVESFVMIACQPDSCHVVLRGRRTTILEPASGVMWILVLRQGKFRSECGMSPGALH
jgi:hypothetical protein